MTEPYPSTPDTSILKPRIAFLDFATLGPDIDTSSLEQLADVEYFDFSDPEHVQERIQQCDVVIVNKVKLDRATLESVERLKLIVIAATGTDNVDSAAARDSGIAVANIRDYCSAAVAQHVFALILSLTQQLQAYDQLVRTGAWSQAKSFALFDYPIRDLHDRVLGIVGYGTLGKAVADLGHAFGMRVMISARPGTPTAEIPAHRVAFDTLLRQADVISLHCPLTDGTHHLVGSSELAAMKSDAILINTARGALIDGDALAQALKDGQIAGAGIDVQPIEPPPTDLPLLAGDIPNLILTPHIAWATQEARQLALEQVVENIAAFYEGRSLRRIV